MLREKEIDLQLDIWKKVIDVQMHFNDLCLRIRSFAVSVLGVLLGASAVAYRFGGNVSFLCFENVPVAVFFLVISLVAWGSFYLMDRFWYHELLKGAVHHALDIEERLKSLFPEISLSHTVKDQSHLSLRMNAAKKLNVFYLLIALVQILAVVVLLFGGVGLEQVKP